MYILEYSQKVIAIRKRNVQFTKVFREGEIRNGSIVSVSSNWNFDLHSN